MPWKNGDQRHKQIGGKHRACTRYAIMQKRLKADTVKNRCYAGIRCMFTKDEFIAWFMPRDFEGCSVDRIDPAGDYSLDNLQVISLAENIRKDKVLVDGDTRRCHRCQQWLSFDSFVKDKRRANGLSTTCKVCERARKGKK